ncbi:MAG: type II toxin-antitoxin system Phd/YefM family antitoxin [Opitutales bacterium]
MAISMAMFIAMNSASIAELKAHSPRIIRSVEAGEPFLITRRNKPVAQILPCRTSPLNRTQVGFDAKVRILGSLTEPALDPDEWGDLSF